MSVQVDLRCLPFYPPPCALEAGISPIGLGLPDGLCSWLVSSGYCLSLPLPQPQHWVTGVHDHTQLFTWAAGIQTQVSMLGRASSLPREPPRPHIILILLCLSTNYKTQVTF